jgi:rod shape-determining protein MreC
MGVVDPKLGVVGITTEVSPDYAAVMSLLHRDSRISGKLLKTGETGTLTWDGKEPNVVTLTNVPKSAKIAKGDTVITSGFSTTFPKGMYIGKVLAVYTEKGSNSYKVKLRTAANFYDLAYVFIIDDVRQEEVDKMLEQLNKQN